MRIWIVKYGESIPFIKGAERSHYFRSGEIVRRLVKRGHEVTWWTGRFEHQTKKHHNVPGNEVQIPDSENSRVILLDSPGYSSNVSPRRFYDHWRIGRSFRRGIEKEEAPDVIMASMPTPELAKVSCDYAAQHGVPVIIDVRDLWPDAIAGRIKAKFGISPALLLRSYDKSVRHVLNCATSVTAISQDCLDWAQHKGQRTTDQKSHDRVYRLASKTIESQPSREQTIRSAWLDRGFNPEAGKKVFSWAGSLTNQAATRALLKAQDLLPQAVRDRISVVICGGGDLAAETRAVAERCSHVIYAGFVPRDEVQFLYDHSDFGLLCYDNTPDFQASFPNKFGEYLMSGLTVITTVEGAMQREYGTEGFIVTVLPTPEKIASAIADLSQATPRSELRIRAQEVFREDFDAEIVYEAFCDHIESHGSHKR